MIKNQKNLSPKRNLNSKGSLGIKFQDKARIKTKTKI